MPVSDGLCRNPRHVHGSGDVPRHLRNAVLAVLFVVACVTPVAPAVAATADGYEPDNSPGSATPLVVDAAAQQHSIYPAAEEDWASLSVTEGYTYRIRITSGAAAEDFDAVLYLYDSDGVTQLDYSDAGWTTPDEVIDYTAPSSSTVYVKVMGYWDSDYGNYALSVTTPGDSYEPDNTSAVATQIPTDGSAQRHSIDPYADLDWVKFDVSAGLTYQITAGSDTKQNVTDLVLYDTDGATPIGGTLYFDDYVQVVYKSNADKTLYGRISRGYMCDEGDEYDVSVSVISDSHEPDDTYDIANTIEPNGLVQNHSLLVDDVDWAYFDAVQGWSYHIVSSPDPQSEGLDTDLDLYDSDGTTHIDEDYPMEGPAVIDYVAESSKRVYVRVSEGGMAVGDYTLQVTAVPVPLMRIASNLDFGTVALGHSAEETITATNYGAAPLLISDVVMTGDGFSVVSDGLSEQVLAPGGSAEMVVRYTATMVYSGPPAAVKHDWTNVLARYNYVNGMLYSISLNTGFQNTGGAGMMPWQVNVDGDLSSGSEPVIAGGRYTMTVTQRVGTGIGTTYVDVLEPVTASFELQGYIWATFLDTTLTRVPEGDVTITSNDVLEPTQVAGLFVTAESDEADPTAEITAPANGATVSDLVEITASASDGVGVDRVEFRIDGVLMCTDTTAPYAFAWDARPVAPGPHAIDARAYDDAGNWADAATVNVTSLDTLAPTVHLTAPASGAEVTGSVSLEATAADNGTITKVEFRVGGELVATDNTGPSPYTGAWDVIGKTPGSYTIEAKAYDAEGNTATDSVTVTVPVLTPTTLTGSSGTKTTDYDSTVTIYAELEATGSPLAGMPVKLYYSYDGTTDWRPSSTEVSEPREGHYQASVKRKTSVYYRFGFAGGEFGEMAYAAATGSAVRIYPQVKLTRLTSWGTLYRYRTYYAKGYIYPKHSNSDGRVTIRIYKKSSDGKYHYVKSVSGYYTYYSSTRTRYTAKIRFSSKGRYKLVARHYKDSKNYTTYGSADYVYVK